MTAGDYIPLSQYPHPSPPSLKAAGYATSYFYRRRVFLAALLASFVIILVVGFEYFFNDGLEFDGDSQIYNTSFPEAAPNAYLPFHFDLDQTAAVSPLLRPVHDLPSSCLDRHYSTGDLCHNPDIPPFNVLWTWVNGSDLLLRQAKTKAEESYAPDDPYRPRKAANADRQFRDHDELRHSIRSVIANFRPYADHFRLLTSDFDVPENNPQFNFSANTRLGQIPQWLDPAKRQQGSSEWRDGSIALSLVPHAHIFKPYQGPVFNSYAIESQFENVPGLSENFIYLNDDFFMTAPLTPISFYTSPYGLVLRMHSDLVVPPNKPNRIKGEWATMEQSNWLLSNRFGARFRPYVAHEAKSVSSALLHEVSQTWPQDVAATASHKFRETAKGTGDFNMLFIFNHFVVERSREAMLWSWIVARLGGLDDGWTQEDSERAWAELGATMDIDSLDVRTAWRETLDKGRVEATLRRSGHTKPGVTTYSFSSMDGYPYNEMYEGGQRTWPSWSPREEEKKLPRCRMNYDECFNVPGLANGTARATDVFKNIAFARPRCGDCAIMALVKASGPTGLSAFLPHSGRVYPADPSNPSPDPFRAIPHLPLVSDWRTGDFALGSVVDTAVETDVREWTLRLLQRYRYVIGDTPSLFERITSARAAKSVLDRIDRYKENALLCINDDVSSGDEEVAHIMKAWQDKKWSRPATWERT